MKHIKIHSFTHLLHLLYCLILALPLCTILVRSLYVQFNKNAFESYYGETINQVNYEDVTTLEQNREYIFSASNVLDLVSETQNIYPVSVQVLTASNNAIINNVNNNRIDRIFFANSGSTNSYIAFSSGTNTWYLNLKTESISFNFQYGTGYVVDSFLLNLIKEYSYNKYSYLDNAFEYSLSRFVDNSNIGRLNLVNWFTDVFLDSSNATNMLYLNFINWYMNYALLVSCVYILFLVLMWFVSLARRLIYKGMEI